MKREHADFHGCPLPFPTIRWRVKILDAADADTLTVRVDRGWFQSNLFDIRLADIDAWERNSGTIVSRALAAVAWKWVLEHCQGRWAYLTTFMDAEKYGRILGTLEYLDDDGTMRELTVELRERGYEKIT